MSTPARTASSYKSGQIGRRRTAFFGRNGVRVALAAACSALLVAGCSQGVGGGLSSNLPPAGGGGLLSFTSVAMPDGIAGRAYSKVAVTSVETQSKTNFPISPTVASGTAPLASCTVSAGALPPGMNAALTVDSTGAGCVISGTPSAAAAGNTYQFTIQALDSNSPPRAAAQSFAMNVRPEFTVTAPVAIVANALPAGVQGRTYGQIPGNAAAMTATTNLSATNGNGAVGAKNYCALSVTPALASLTLTQVAGTNNCQLQGSGALAAAGSYKVTVAITDNPIVDPETNLAAVPANTIAAASNATLNVAAPLKIVAADSVSATPPKAVAGRAYGSGTGCSGGACSPLTYAATGGLPSVEPADSYLFSSSAALTAAGINCAATASSSLAKTTCSGTAAGTGANFSVTVDDPGNFATPSGSASSTTASTSSLSLTVDSALALAVSPDPAANPAVQNRPYGTGTGCTGAGGACVAPTYTPSGGLGTYSFPAITGAPPAGITCAPNAGNTAEVCSGTPTATGPSTFGVAASDVGNASTPADTTAVVSKTLTVNGALTLTPPASLPPAVNGRAFGTGAGCSGGNCVPAVFTISGGLGTYAATAGVVSAPGTWTCALAGSNYNCSSTAVISGTPNLSITASDGASPTTPGATTASATVAVTVSPSMAVTPLGGAAPDAVTGRSYGSAASGCSGGACLPLQYSVAGGLGNYQAGTLAVADSASDSLACSVASLTYSCSSGAVNGNATASAAMTMTAAEAGNASTPGGTAVDVSRTLAIQSALAISQNLGTAWPDAVQNRSYGGSGFTSAQFSATGGISGYTFTTANFPSTFTCSGSPTYSCSSASITSAPAVFHPQVTVKDTGNPATPQGSVSTSASTTLNVNSPLVLQAPGSTPATAVNGRGYGSNGTVSNTCAGPTACQALNFSVSGGLGNYAAATIVTAPGGWSCPLVGSNYECATSSVADAGPFPHSNVPVTLTASDTANSTTPAVTTGQITADLSINAALQFASSPTLPLTDGVKNRPYGSGSGCIPGPACAGLTYGATGGITPYNFSSSGFPLGLNCITVSSTYSCTASPITDAPNSYSPQVSLADAGNASTPPPSTPLTSPSATLVIHPQLSLSVNPDPATNPAVQGRDYGVTSDSGCSSGSCLAPTYTPAGGLGNYIMTAPSSGSLPAGITCVPANQGTSSATASCSGAAIAGATSTFSVAAIDTANLSTPAATVGTDPQSTLSKTITVNTALAASGPILPNGLVGYTYPNPAISGTPTALTASNGIGAYTWIQPGGTGCTNGTSLPGGISLNALTGVLSGTPTTASTTATDFAFQACVTDTSNATTPAAIASTGSLTLNVMAPLAYVAETDNIEAFNTQTHTIVKSISSTGNVPFGVAFSPSGRYAYVTLANVDQLAVYDTITNTAARAPLTLSTGCFPEGVGATATNIFIACNGLDEVDVVNVSGATFTVGSPISIGVTGTSPVGVAVSPDGTRAYVTLSAINKLFVVDSSTATPAALGGTNPVSLTTSEGTIPQGIAVALAGGTGPGTVAYIAKQGVSPAGDGVEVLTLTGDVFNDVAGANISTSSDSSAVPTFVAITPDSARVYVALNGVDKFAVIDNTSATPAKLSGSPFSLSESGSGSEGVAIPPQSPYQAFITENGQSKVAVVNDSATTPTETATISLGGTAPLLIATTPAPK
ncbi:MAG TPA: YncE family protein [Candidatus Acidoferrales bacterium]|nr:YncE family protein [Candidatus Acidoferrales bacterium]